jgi:ribosomal protein S18 acetylase RimI-like enzyme
MRTVHYRLANKSDVPAMARIRAAEWETEEYWRDRIFRYVNRELHPQWALMPRVIHVALEGETLVGFIAGHLTVRFACDGELEWINVVPEHRGSAVGAQLLCLLAAWFAGQKASRVCVDVDPANTIARRFYKRHGADDLNEHWLVWNDIRVVLGQS